MVSKAELSNCKTEDITNIFMRLNSTKACMVLSGHLDKVYRNNMRKVEFYDEINSLKKELQNYI